MLIAPLVSTLLNTEDSPGYDERLGKPVRPSIQYLGEPARTLICPELTSLFTVDEINQKETEIVFCKLPTLAVITNFAFIADFKTDNVKDFIVDSLNAYVVDTDNNFIKLCDIKEEYCYSEGKTIFEHIKNELYDSNGGNPNVEGVQLFNKYGTNPAFYISAHLTWNTIQQHQQANELLFMAKIDYIEGTPSTITTENKFGDR